ncbi:DegV family protein [Gemella cuniculi]|uniref:DegV family protein n=1 Tax=Gemella cuniculi TaxID=150240 RepID=UPI00040DE21F|nr:DegV family protein [Gemella cuniculi]
MKTAFVCDSTLQVSKEFCENNPITIIPLEVRLNNEVYEDNVTITPEEFYSKINDGMKPSTSQPSVGKILKVFEDLKQGGVKRIVAFSISNKLSGTYSSFSQARDLISDIDIKIIDTKQLAKIVGYAVEKIIKDFSNGKISYEQIEDEYYKLYNQQNILVTVETMEHLYAGGRLTKAQFVLSNLLNILPIITIKDGLLAVNGKHRGINKTLTKICEEIKEKNPKTLIILYTNDELLQKAQDAIKKVFGDIEIITEIVSPVIGSHAGPKAVGIGYLQYEK